MKYSRTAFSVQRSAFGKFYFLLFTLLILISQYQVIAANEELIQKPEIKLRVPGELNGYESNLPTEIDIKKLPDFVSKEPLSDLNPIPINTRLRLIIDSFINVKTSMAGDYFKAHVVEDFYLPTNPPQLIIPKDSWVRGRISFFKKPNIFIRTGKIGFHLDTLATPLGKTVPLDTELNIQQGYINEQGCLTPLVSSNTNKNADTLLRKSLPLAIEKNKLGLSLAGDLISTSVTALYLKKENVDGININKGQELQLVLERDIQHL
ncbi:MAG: hypothetical protein HYY52_03620 [Candidatus Melainabacteria bacterium]|nr:hypothetical protein [Candidatus Melainabacteria bacterium]